MNISLIYLFGSSIIGTQRAESDIDIGVVFEKPEGIKNTMILFEELYQSLSQDFPDRDLDIVFLDFAPLTLQFEVVTTGKVIYRVSREFEYDYKEKIIKEYIDFKPLLDVQDQILLERI
ncbi:MAG TPA: nucleotidyltransferase domain-containing protein [Candidatus Atribacteria bacterium]|nr:nucleotidyltransferase domain-containing protein [Candidatus Atribacteria bacterium]